MYPYPLSFLDWKRKLDMEAIGASAPIGTGFGFDMPTADQEPFVKSGLGGGMRDSNIQDTTGTTGGNAGAADAGSKGFDWEGLAGGLGQLAKGMKGMQGKSAPEMRVPTLTDDSAQRMAAASQLWQAVMQKRKPRGLI